MLHDVMPGTEEHLLEQMRSAYVGIDPTADSLHVGHLVSVMLLKHFQNAGHKPLALIGGATGMIGDPSGKSDERNLLDEATLRHNQESIKKQLETIWICGHCINHRLHIDHDCLSTCTSWLCGCASRIKCCYRSIRWLEDARRRRSSQTNYFCSNRANWFGRARCRRLATKTIKTIRNR